MNKSPPTTIEFKTPEEIWSGNPASYKHLRIFGCSIYVHTKQGKLDARDIKGMFVDYSNGISYKVWCGEDHWCLIRRDVQLNEITMINKYDQATLDTDMNAKKTQVTRVIDLDSLIEVESISDLEDNVQS